MKPADVSIEWKERSHFMRTAATAMRRILVDRARAKLCDQRGGGAYRIEMPELAALMPDGRPIELDAALPKLGLKRPDHAKLIELRYFAGSIGVEAAAVLGISPATVDRMWRFTRAWLEVGMLKTRPIGKLRKSPTFERRGQDAN